MREIRSDFLFATARSSIRKLLPLFTIFVFTSCSRRNDFGEGQQQALRDLSAQKLTIALQEDEPNFWRLNELLKSRYNIGTTIMTLPANPSRALDWSKGYNSVMLPEISMRFGSNVLEAARTQAGGKSP